MVLLSRGVENEKVPGKSDKNVKNDNLSIESVGYIFTIFHKDSQFPLGYGPNI